MVKKENIQLWRVFSCILVFTVHLGQRLALEGNVRKLTDFGEYGVYFFFIISGFLIANSYYLYGNKNIKLFIFKRVIKILPLYYSVILYYFLVHHFIFCDVPEDKTGLGWFRYLFILNSIIPCTKTYFWDNLGITWTIPYFVFAYITIPFILKFIKTYKTSIILFSFSLFIANYFIQPEGWFSLLRGIPYFIEGIIIYYCIKEGRQIITSTILAFLIIFHITLGRIDTYLYSYIFMLLILITENLCFTSNIIKKILKKSDQYSYTFYLVHGIVFIHILDRHDWGRFTEALIGIIGTLILTLIVNNFIEKPLQRLICTQVEDTKE